MGSWLKARRMANGITTPLGKLVEPAKKQFFFSKPRRFRGQ